MEKQKDDVLLHIEKVIEFQGFADIGCELKKLDLRRWENQYKHFASIYFHLLKDDKYEGFTRNDDKTYVVHLNKNYSVNQSIVQTNNSVRKVNRMFYITIVFSALSFGLSLATLILQYKTGQSELILKQPLPIKVEIKQILPVDSSQYQKIEGKKK